MLPSLSRLKIADLAEKTDHFDLKVVPTASPRVEERVAASRADVGRLQRSSFVGSANTRLPKPIVPKFDQCGEFFGSVFETSSEMPGLPVVSNTTSTQKLELLIYLFGDSISTVDINDDSFRITNKESLSKIIEVARQQNKTLGCEAAEMGIDQSSMSDVERQCQVHTRVAYYAIQTNTHYRGVRGLLFLSMENNLIERYEKYKKLSDKQQQEVKGQVDTNNYPKEALTDRAYQPKNPVVVQSVEWMTFDAARKRLAILVRMRKQCILRLFLMAINFYQKYEKIELYASQFISTEDKDDLRKWFEYKTLGKLPPRPNVNHEEWISTHLPWLRHFLFLQAFPKHASGEMTVRNIPQMKDRAKDEIFKEWHNLLLDQTPAPSTVPSKTTADVDNELRRLHGVLLPTEPYPFGSNLWRDIDVRVKNLYYKLMEEIVTNGVTRPSGTMSQGTEDFIHYYLALKKLHTTKHPDKVFLFDRVISQGSWTRFVDSTRELGFDFEPNWKNVTVEELDNSLSEYDVDRPAEMDQQDFDMQQNVARVKKSLEALKNFEGEPRPGNHSGRERISHRCVGHVQEWTRLKSLSTRRSCRSWSTGRRVCRCTIRRRVARRATRLT